ncbi:MAG: T9SS type A sorting domain-containing protein [Bacteroidia bacterium]
MKKSLLTTYTLLLTTYVFAQPANFVAHGIGGGGAQYSPSINPANPSEIYSSTDMTDVYHSTNAGASWNVINFNQLTGGQFAMVQFTNNNNIRYCQSENQVEEALVPVKSTDAGVTWNPITDPTSGNGSWYVIANPQNYNQVIVSDYADLYLSNDGGTTFGAAFYTDNSGNGAYVAGTFFDGDTIFICTNKGLIISINGGASWSAPATNGVTSQDFLSFAGAKVGSTTRFFCVTQTSGNVYVGTNGENASSYASVYSMTYPGSWVQKTTGINSGDWPFFVSMAANNVNEAYLGGESGSGIPIVLKTGDAGAKWNYVFNTTNNQNIQTGYCGSGGDLSWYWPGYVFGLNVCRTDSNIVVETDEGFIHQTTDGGKTWQALYVPPSELNPANAPTPTGRYYKSNGIEMTSCWDLMWFDSLHVLSGYTDITATRSNDGGNSWGFDCSGLYNYNTTYKFQENPANKVIYAATSSIHDMYMSDRLTDNIIDAGDGEVMYSTDTGKTFNAMYNFGKPVIWLALDPTNSTRMYASVINHAGSGSQGGIWVSDNINLNASSTWTHCNNPSRTQGHPFNIHVLNDGTVVATFSGRINAAGKFSDSSGVFMSKDQGSTWTDVSDPGMKYWTMDLTVDPNDATQDTWYVCVFSGWGGGANNQGGLYRTINRGTSWTKIVNASMNNVGDTSSCYSVSFDPNNKGAAYLTTEAGGLFYTTNIEATNPVFTQVSSYPFEQPNRVFFNPYIKTDVWINSFGNGLEMGSSIPTGIEQLSVSSCQWSVYPNPNNGKFFIESSVVSGQSSVEVYNMLGEKVYSGVLNSGINQIVMSNEESGVYLYRILNRNGVAISSGKLIIQK